MEGPARLPLAVTMGDPAGVGPQITWDCWRRRSADQQPFYVLADPDLMHRAARHVAIRGEVHEIQSPAEAGDAFAHGLPVLPFEGAACAIEPGRPSPDSVGAIVGSIRAAVADVAAGRAAAVVTNPIAKALLMASGFPHPGHTEFLAELAAAGGPAPLPVMMLAGGGLRVALATIHRPLSTVPAALTSELIVRVGSILARDLALSFGLGSARIGVCGLNPHAGEGGALGSEEVNLINPACAELRARGVDASDARPADSIFHEMLGGRFDAVLAMYHDQGLIPVKTLDLWGGVNVTLGLPFVRTSPDHGVAYDAAQARTARSESLMAALRMAESMAAHRALAG